MKSKRTSDQIETKARKTFSSRKGRSTSRRGSASSRPVSRPTPAASTKTSRTASSKKTSRAALVPTEEATKHVTLPGTLFRRDNQWWWDVQLPGEDEATARALTPDGAETPTEDLEVAQEVALHLWERALTRAVERRVRVESGETAAKLKAQFLEKVRDFSQIVETTRVKLEAEIQARTEAEAKLAALAGRSEATVTCECCETSNVTTASAKRIDSGQLLCLAALQAEIKRIDSELLADCHM